MRGRNKNNPWNHFYRNANRLIFILGKTMPEMLRDGFFRHKKEECSWPFPLPTDTVFRRYRRILTGDSRLLLEDLWIVAYCLNVDPSDLAFMPLEQFLNKYAKESLTD
jgi:hypothetical protein